LKPKYGRAISKVAANQSGGTAISVRIQTFQNFIVRSSIVSKLL